MYLHSSSCSTGQLVGFHFPRKSYFKSNRLERHSSRDRRLAAPSLSWLASFSCACSPSAEECRRPSRCAPPLWGEGGPASWAALAPVSAAELLRALPPRSAPRFNPPPSWVGAGMGGEERDVLLFLLLSKETLLFPSFPSGGVGARPRELHRVVRRLWAQVPARVPHLLPGDRGARFWWCLEKGASRSLAVNLQSCCFERRGSPFLALPRNGA